MSKRKSDGKFAAVVIARDKCCQKCGATDNLCAHHIIPVSIGGTDNPLNGRALCPSCHADKHPYVPRGLFFPKVSGKADTTKWNATSLAGELGCSTRTVTRAAKKLGIERGCKSRWGFTEAEKEKIAYQVHNRTRMQEVRLARAAITGEKLTVSYTLDDCHIAAIEQIAKKFGGCSESAALRYIIDQYVKLTWAAAQHQRPAPQAQEMEGESDE